jgi:hypothetical protein
MLNWINLSYKELFTTLNKLTDNLLIILKSIKLISNFNFPHLILPSFTEANSYIIVFQRHKKKKNNCLASSVEGIKP